MNYSTTKPGSAGRSNSLILVMIFAVFSIAFMIANTHIKAALDDIKRENVLLRDEIKNVTQALNKSHALNEDLMSKFPRLSEDEISEFKKKGLADPESNIIQDLGSREELMPFKGMFGARPSFYPEVRMSLLNAKWVYLYYDDGTNKGQSLLKYRVANNGMIEWNILDTL
ncbi:MAG: hypothetical protein JXB48_08705 [Candidatus Latescibacteria bacterium]|nr:hypothetical protein [Candidatus Latescibacterota bacterium]